MPRNLPHWLTRTPLAVLLLCLCLRGALVLSLSDCFFYGEELEKGTAAKAMLDSLDLPHAALAYHPYEGGGFVISHLKALAFLLVGQNLLAHKLLALCTCSLVLLAGWYFAARHFGLVAAQLFGLFFACAPRSWQELSLLSLGIHFEACFFVVVLLDLCLRWTRSTEAVRNSQAFCFGVLAGFGLYFSYQVVIPLVACALWLALHRPRLFRSRALLLALFGLGIGGAPWLWMWSQVGPALLDIHGTSSKSLAERSSLLSRFIAALVSPAYLAFWFQLLATLVVGACLLVSGGRSGPGALLLLFACLWSAAYLVSDFLVAQPVAAFSWMRFAPLWVVGTLLVAGGCARGWADHRKLVRWLGRTLTLVWLTLGSAAFASALDWRDGSSLRANWDLLCHTKGYDYAGWMAKVVPRLELSERQKLVALGAFKETASELLYADLAHAAWRRAPAGDVWLELNTLFPREGQALELGRGAAWASELGQGARSSPLANVLAATQSLPPEEAKLMQRAVARSHWSWAVTSEAIVAEAEEAARLQALPEYFFGLGERAWRWLVLTPYGMELTLRPAAAIELLDAVAGVDSAAFQAGFAHARALWRL